MTILFTIVLSMISIFSCPGASVKARVWPDVVLMIRLATLPPMTAIGAARGGIDVFVHKPPSTYGRLTSPCSNATSTSSLISGIN